MKRITAVLLFVLLIAGISSAELLTTADTLGAGKWVVLGGGIQDQNLMDVSGATMTSYCGYVGYGLTDQLDVCLNLGALSSSGLTGIKMTGLGYGLSVKYNILKEDANLPGASAFARHSEPILINAGIIAVSLA